MSSHMHFEFFVTSKQWRNRTFLARQIIYIQYSVNQRSITFFMHTSLFRCLWCMKGKSDLAASSHGCHRHRGFAQLSWRWFSCSHRTCMQRKVFWCFGYWRNWWLRLKERHGWKLGVEFHQLGLGRRILSEIWFEDSGEPSLTPLTEISEEVSGAVEIHAADGGSSGHCWAKVEKD